MVNSALSNLDTGAALSAGDLIYIVQGGNSRKRALTALGAGLLNDTGYTGALSTIGVTALGRSLLDDTGTTGALTTLGVTALGRSLLDDTGQTTMQSTLGLGTAARENIGTSGANVPLMSTVNTWSADQKISATTAIFILNETDGTSTHNSTWFAQASNQLFIQTRSNSGTLVSSDYILAKGASGVTSHDWRINGTQKLLLNSSGLTITDTLTLGSATTIRSGSGTPEGAVTASVGSLFLRTDGGAGTTLYVKESGSGNTGWVAK